MRPGELAKPISNRIPDGTRKTYSNLSVDDFRNCMSAFCVVTYLKEEFVFTRLQFRNSLQQALKLEKIEVNIDDLTNDMIESTCLIQIEGTDYVFTHRSFQEYFAAVFICRSPAGGARALLDRISRRSSDDVINLAYSINRGLIERDWIIPTLDAVLTSESALKIHEDLFGFVDENIGGILINIGPSGLPDLGLYYNETGRKLYMISSLFVVHPRNVPIQLHFISTPTDREIINASYNEMARKKDARLDGMRRLQGKKVNSYGVFELEREDMKWLERTTLPAFLDRLLNFLREIANSCKVEAQGQQDILANLALR